MSSVGSRNAVSSLRDTRQLGLFSALQHASIVRMGNTKSRKRILLAMFADQEDRDAAVEAR